MIIGFDAKRAVRNFTGLGNYSRLVIEEVATARPDDLLLLYTPDLRRNPRLKKIENLKNARFVTPAETRLPKAVWRTWGITKQLRADNLSIFHGLSNELPLNIAAASIPSVVTIHDLIFLRLPYCYKPIDRTLYNYKYSKSAKSATRIIAVSERTKADITEFYGIDPDKIDVVYQGCDDSFREMWDRERIEDLRLRYSLPKRYIVQVGTIEKRKNLEITVKALTAIPDDIDLVVIGRDNGYLKEVEHIALQSGVRQRIHIISDLPFADLPGVYQAADVAAYPSRYEGFGIPVIEALESQTPVVAAKGSCLEEAGGPGGTYVDPDAPREMAEALNALLRDKNMASMQAREGKSYVSRFNCSGMAGAILETYQKGIDQFNREKECR